jgi:endonuclease III
MSAIVKVSRDRFVDAVRAVAARNRETLAEIRARASDDDHRDLWTSVVRSMATMQRSSGWDLLRPPHARTPIAYETLLLLDKAKRVETLERVLTSAKVRMAPKKARWLADNIDIIANAGGPLAFNRAIDDAPDRDSVMRKLMELRGFGPKYARNLPMDRRHPLFLDSIAIDSRIDSIGKHLGLPEKSSYEAQEQYYLAVAREAGLEDGWEMDRVLYNFTEQILEAMGVPTAKRRSPRPREC